MAGFVENVSNPGSVTGSFPVHEAPSAVVGQALGGLAKILDVGLKASAEDRSERLTKEVGDRLAPVTTPNNPPQTAVGGQDVFNDGSLQQWEKSQGLDKIGKLAQANRHSPDKVSTTSMMTRASSITQQIINDHPRYANEIRQKVQQILGVNPNEEMIKSQLDDEKTIKAQQFAVQQDMVRSALEVGVAPIYNQDGSLDSAKMAAAGAKIRSIHQDMQHTTEELTQDNLRGEINARNNPKLTAEQLKAKNQNTYMGPLNQVYNLLMEHGVGAVTQQLLNPSRGIPFKGGSANGPLPYGTEQDFRQSAIIGLGNTRVAFDRAVQEYNTLLTNKGQNPLTASEMQEVKTLYDKQFDDMHKMLVEAPKEVVEAHLDMLRDMVTTNKIDFHTAYPLVADFIDKWGETSVQGALQVAIDNNPQAKTNLAAAVTGTLNSVSAVAGGQTRHIPDGATGASLAAANTALGKNADNLTPKQLVTYGNATSAMVEKGLQYENDYNQMAGALRATSTPALLKAFDAYAKDPAHAEQAQDLGGNLYLLNNKFKDTILPNMKPATVGGRTYTPFYNPQAGRVEVEVKDGHGKVITSNITYINNPGQYGAPAKIIEQAKQLNQSLDSMVHLKKYSAEGEMQDIQLKQALMQNMPTNGRALIQMPKPPAEPAPAPAKKQEAAEAKPDTSGWTITVQ